MDLKDIDIERMTASAEEAKGSAIDRILVDLPLEDRFKVVQAMDKLNEQHRKIDPSIPDLVVTFGKNGYASDAWITVVVNRPTWFDRTKMIYQMNTYKDGSSWIDHHDFFKNVWVRPSK